MTFGDTLKGRFGRFNPPQPAGAAPGGGQGRVLPWVGGVLHRLAGALALPRQRQPHRAASERKRRLSLVLWVVRPLRLAVVLAVLMLIGWAAVSEMQTSDLQAALFTRLDRTMRFAMQPGPSHTVRFPRQGPYDERLGYSQLPQFIDALLAQRYRIDSQAHWSPGLSRFVEFGGFPIYREKDTAGLRIYDDDGKQVYGVQFPRWIYPDFASVPPLIANSLSFIEDKYLLDSREPERNPAIEWKRFGLAAVGRIAGVVVPGIHAGGGSTLATQTEKFRHSFDGRTRGIAAKLRQMLTASARAYIDGPDTLMRRQQILTTYLNSTPLGSMPGYGEVIGVPEALRIWFGTDYRAASRILDAQPRTQAELARKGEIYREALSLLLSERRPTYYLMQDHRALAALTDRYLHVLSDAGVIGPRLRDAALAAGLNFLTAPPPIDPVSYVSQKATEDVRDKLVGLLQLPDLYSLDRLDLNAETSIDTAAQARITALLQRLSDPEFVRTHDMVGRQLLGGGALSKVTWSFVLYERGADRNYVRIHADSMNKPFDINSGGKLMMGSTAKLRTLITYLDIITVLHHSFADLRAGELSRIAATAEDPLTAWAAQYLAHTGDRGLQPMLDAAMQRTYSAAPGSFFTGGGVQSFGNFEHSEDSERPTVEIAFQHSINCAFVRLLRDVVTYYTAASGVQIKQVLENPNDPQRLAYLHRFVDGDSKRFLYRFYSDYHGLSRQDAMRQLASRTRPIASRLTTVYLSVHPNARIAQLQAFLLARLPHLALTDKELWHLYLTESPQRLNLSDRGYISGIHPLELWLVRYLYLHPHASWNQVVKASAQVRQATYKWLFKGSMAKQDTRIRILLEEDAFDQIINNWRALGYPFAHLVPSLGTVLGASGDRPDALAKLMGIIMNDGIRKPTETIQHLQFAAGTPYETDLSPTGAPERVMPLAVAETVQHALLGVVADGTASRLRGVYTLPDGSPLPVGGKTGTGDNRFDHFAVGGGITASRVVDRTATFVFFLGPRFYGTVTVYTPGQYAAHFHYSSALAVQVLKVMKPELTPLLDAPPPPSETQPQVMARTSRS
ncbi:MAG TPA: transglycosylase domain-containing protein [Stellaceae bacterium]|nr:transglycosylase domain-containing protein [Stellaceae bacterium]